MLALFLSVERILFGTQRWRLDAGSAPARKSTTRRLNVAATERGSCCGVSQAACRFREVAGAVDMLLLREHRCSALRLSLFDHSGILRPPPLHPRVAAAMEDD